MGNILLRVQELIGSTEEIYQKYGFPEKTPIERLDGKSPQPEAPLYTVQSMKTNKPADRVLCADIIISDFSDASILPHINSECGTPIHSRPPEFHLKITDQYGQAADIWTAACTLYHILGTVHLFTPFAWSREDVMIEIVSLLGPLPKDLMEKWEVVLQSDTDECGQDPRPWNADDAVRRSMQDALDGMAYGTRGHKYTQDELDDLADLLSSMLKYRPSERITADEACQSAWMQKWGLPAIARTDG